MSISTRKSAREEAAGRPSTPERIPLLRNGDRLTAAEFERRYDAMPHLKKAELIEGRVFIPSPDFFLVPEDNAAMSSPVSFRNHAGPHFNLITGLGLYMASTPGSKGGDNGTIRLDLDNRPQPDAFLIILPEFGGQARISDDDYVEGAPELVVEIAYSSVSYDLHDKLDVYRRSHAGEYLVWRVEDETMDWFVNRGGRFEPLPPAADGTLRSEVFPGLWLDPAALVRDDMASVPRTVQAGLASPEHAEFVARLRQQHDARNPTAGGGRP